MHSLPHYQHPPPEGCTVTTDEPTWTHHNHPKSIVYITVHSWCCTFCGFGQMYNDMYPSLWYHTEYFHCLKNPPCSTSISPPPPPPPIILATTDHYNINIALTFPECHIVGIMQYVAFSDWFPSGIVIFMVVITCLSTLVKCELF